MLLNQKISITFLLCMILICQRFLYRRLINKLNKYLRFSPSIICVRLYGGEKEPRISSTPNSINPYIYVEFSTRKKMLFHTMVLNNKIHITQLHAKRSRAITASFVKKYFRSALVKCYFEPYMYNEFYVFHGATTTTLI